MQRRRTITLDGRWEIAEGSAAAAPKRFEASVPVPGLVDMATPPFEAVGLDNGRREAFWYRRRFSVAGGTPARATLKLNKARYGTQVMLNGAVVGEHGPNFTPALFDVSEHLREDNEILVRLGAWRDATPPGSADGLDVESQRYIPGIYDSVSLVLSGTPHIVAVQTAPDLERGSVHVTATVRNAGVESVPVVLDCVVREAGSGTVAGRARSELVTIGSDEETELGAEVAIEDARWWSPEEPFLYELEAATEADAVSVRFGMRTFTFDREQGRAVLNGRPYYLRGTNVCIFRFFEDPERSDRPWNREWVERLHARFKDMHWNSIRYCIGFPPEIWYEVADELGFLITDEYPIWYPFIPGMSRAIDELARNGSDVEPYALEDPTIGVWPDHLSAESLIPEFQEWMRERCNHPCVVTWDAQNETLSDETAKVIAAVRHLDPQNRPWDNGYGAPGAECDTFEAHWYPFAPFFTPSGESLSLAKLKTASKTPQGVPMLGAPLEEAMRYYTAAGNGETLMTNASVNAGAHAIVVNEYGYLWLTRDGDPTALTRRVYARLEGWPVETRADRFNTYARLLAAETEFLRCNRAVAGVLHFCGLSYSRVDGDTCDNFVDVGSLEFEEHFWRYVRDAFNPVGVMVDVWDDAVAGGVPLEVPVVVVNDLYEPVDGTVTLCLRRGDDVAFEQQRRVHSSPLGQERLHYVVPVPVEPGRYQLDAELRAGEASVHSLRDFTVR